MPRYVILSEEIFYRYKELVNKDGKSGAKETLFLYQLIVFYSYGKGVCKKTLSEICETHQLEYHNSTRRAKILRTKGWIEDVGKYFRPLIVHKNDGSKTVNFTPQADEESVNFTPNDNQKSVKITPFECKNYTENDEKGVIFTPTYKEGINYLNTNNFDKHTTQEKSSVCVPNERKSKFSIEEITRYVEICQKRGDDIRNPKGLAISLYQTGTADTFISATLYPPETETHVEYDDEYSEAAQPLDDAALLEAREFLGYMTAKGRNLSEFESFYAPGDWQRLIQELKNADS